MTGRYSQAYKVHFVLEALRLLQEDPTLTPYRAASRVAEKHAPTAWSIRTWMRDARPAFCSTACRERSARHAVDPCADDVPGLTWEQIGALVRALR